MTSACTSASAPSSRALPYVALAGSIASFCVGTAVAKYLFPVVGAMGTSAYRVGFSAIILLLAFQPWRAPLSRADGWKIIRYGATLGVMNLCFYMALRTIPLGLAIAIEFLGPLSLSLIHSRRPAHFAAVAAAAGGLSLLLPWRVGAQALDPVGVGFALGAGLCWALYIVFGKQTGHIPGKQAVALGMATAALVVVPFGIQAAGASLLSPHLVLLGLGTALLSSAIPYSLEIFAIQHIPSSRIGVLLSVEPAAGTLAGALLLGEHLTSMQGLAVTLVVLASAGSVLTQD